MEELTENRAVFGRAINYIGSAESMEEYLTLLNENLEENNTTSYFYRGETQDYGETALLPQLFRNPKWVENEHKMINEFVAKFPNEFPKGTSTFDIIVNADHFSLPSRVLDISYSAFTGLFMACYNFSSKDKVDDTNDGFVYIFKVPQKDIKNWTSDTVTLLSNLAIMKSDFPDESNWKHSYDVLMHVIKVERPDFYDVYEGNEDKYKNDFNRIVCVESKMLNSRITNQKGLFFLFGINGKKSDFAKMKFDDDVEIYSIRIDKNHKAAILKQLEMCGYDRMTMFPDMQNVCENIKENYKN